jgi:hypothetical protein
MQLIQFNNQEDKESLQVDKGNLLNIWQELQLLLVLLVYSLKLIRIQITHLLMDQIWFH